MKKVLRIATILICLFLQSPMFASTVIVKGTVKDSANNPVSGRTVKIYSIDSSNNGCIISHTVVTNPNGFYIDTLSCNGDIRKLTIIVENCNGIKITNTPNVFSTPNYVESNFIICSPTSATPVSCKAAFSYISSATGIRFNGAGCLTVSGDSIISRSWTFGDSTPVLTGNIVDPTHIYNRPGIYNVCLTITTKRGCQSSYCQKVVFTPATNDCAVQAMISSERVAYKQIRFNSNQSTTALGDSIVQRIWKFSDGTSLDGNQVNPLKTFKDTGVYSVCVSVRTAKGCEKQYCISVTVRDSVPGVVPIPTGCKALFSYTIKDSTVQFNSADSKASIMQGDSIISRIWYFSDGSTSASLTGNVIAPSHKFSKPGTYNIYLAIKTKMGCESKYTLVVVVPAVVIPSGCRAVFSYTIKDSTIYFKSGDSKASTLAVDSIISRTWSYTDSTHNLVLNGNVMDTSISLRGTNIKPGSYYVTLVIKTKLGCSSKFTLAVIIPKPVIPTNCKAIFDYTIKDSTIQFCSCDSKASSMAGDSIISRTWSYKDSTHNYVLTGNVSDTAISLHNTNIKPGIYYVTLVIKTKYGCESKVTVPVVIPKPYYDLDCKAYFTHSIKDSIIRFNSIGSFASSTPGDSIVARTWSYIDSAHNYVLNGNIVDTSISLRNTNIKPGTYYVTLSIKTKYGCESKIRNAIVIAGPIVPIACKAGFTFTAQGRTVKFNSSSSRASSSTDSIISRIWLFGDNSSALQGNTISPTHNYAKPGKYNVLLYIKTKSGCESNTSATITLLPEDCPNNIQFATSVNQKKVTFSSQIIAGAGDSILQRIWSFGDNSSLAGNQSKTEKEYCFFGTYNTCLQIKTVYGCEAKVCKEIRVEDTATKPQSAVDYVKIISINPNPVVTRMITTIYSRNSNTDAEITIIDAYGNRRLNLKKTLASGNNMIEIATECLPHGPYYLKVSTQKGIDSKLFYKL